MVFRICFRLSNVFKNNCRISQPQQNAADTCLCDFYAPKPQRLLQNLLKTLLPLCRTIDLRKMERLPGQ